MLLYVHLLIHFYYFVNNKEKLFVCVCLYSFGDGVQYPVQLKHLPEQTVNQIATNYESMGTTTFPAMNGDDATDVQSHESRQTVTNQIDNGKMFRDAESEMNLLQTNGGVHVQVQPSLNVVLVDDSNKSKNGTVAIDIVPV